MAEVVWIPAFAGMTGEKAARKCERREREKSDRLKPTAALPPIVLTPPLGAPFTESRLAGFPAAT